jgi:hypothetical protein
LEKTNHIFFYAQKYLPIDFIVFRRKKMEKVPIYYL